MIKQNGRLVAMSWRFDKISLFFGSGFQNLIIELL